MECEPPENLLIYTSGAPAELLWSLDYLSWSFEGGSGSSTDFQDTAHSDNAGPCLSGPASNAAAAAADKSPHATSPAGGTALAQQPLPALTSPGASLPLQPATSVAKLAAPACHPPLQTARARAHALAAGSGHAGASSSASPPAVRTVQMAGAQQPAEQQVADASSSGAASGAAASAATPGTDSGRCPNGKQRSATVADEGHHDQEQQQSGGLLNTRVKQNERKRDEVLSTVTCTAVVKALA